MIDQIKQRMEYQNRIKSRGLDSLTKNEILDLINLQSVELHCVTRIVKEVLHFETRVTTKWIVNAMTQLEEWLNLYKSE